MEPFSFGAPKRRRLAMQFGYEMRPSFWQEVRSHSHLVIAAIGTAALLGVAAVALWLALPASERQAIASSEQIVPTFPVKTTKLAAPTTVVAAAAPVAAVAPKATPKSNEASQEAIAKADIPALASNDPRWTGSEPKTASNAASAAPDRQTNQTAAKPGVATAFAEPTAETDAAAQLAKTATAANKTDGARTAAIPAVEPQVPDTRPAAAESDGNQVKAKPRKVAAAGNGRILRAVTMRAGPKRHAAAIGTVPAKTSVQVVSCSQWCQIVYNGKRGWVYKSYLKSGG